jgi:hypothetical protein
MELGSACLQVGVSYLQQERQPKRTQYINVNTERKAEKVIQ